MNFACNKCDTRYTIADEKLRGKVLKIRCRNCSALITVRDPASAQPRARSTYGSGMYRRPGGAGVRRTASSESIRAVGRRVAKPIEDARKRSGAGGWDTGGSGSGAVERPVARKRGHGVDPDGPPGIAPRRGDPRASQRRPDPFAEARRYRWFVSVEAGELGPISFQELLERVGAGEADGLSYGWREGLADWKLLREIDELKALFEPGGQAAAAAADSGMADLSDFAEEDSDADEMLAERTVVADPAQLAAVMGGMPEADHEIVEEDDDSANLTALASGAVPRLPSIPKPAAPAASGAPDLLFGEPASGAPPAVGLGAAPSSPLGSDAAPAAAASGSQAAAARAAIPRVPPPTESGPAPLQPILEPSIAGMEKPPEAIASGDVVVSSAAPPAAVSSTAVPIPPEAKSRTALWAVLAAMLGAAITAGVLLLVFLGTDVLEGDSDGDEVAEVDEDDDDDTEEPEDDDDDDDDVDEPESDGDDDDDEIAGTTGDGAMVFEPDVVAGDKKGPKKGGGGKPKTSEPVPDYASIYSGAKTATSGTGPSIGGGAAKPTKTTIGSAEISSVVTKNRGAIKLCYERALKKGEGEGGGKATVIVTVRSNGTVKKVAVEPPLQRRLLRIVSPRHHRPLEVPGILGHRSHLQVAHHPRERCVGPIQADVPRADVRAEPRRCARVRRRGRGRAPATPADPRIVVNGHKMYSVPLGLSFELTDAWEMAPPLPGADFIARDKVSGAMLVGSAVVSDPPGDTLDMTLDKLMAKRRERYDHPATDTRRDGVLGEVPARVATLSVPTEDGWSTLTLTLAKKGSYTVSMTCKGLEDAQKACDAILAKLVMAK